MSSQHIFLLLSPKAWSNHTLDRRRRKRHWATGWKVGLGPEAELDSAGWREGMQNYAKNHSLAGRGRRGNQRAISSNGQAKDA